MRVIHILKKKNRYNRLFYILDNAISPGDISIRIIA